jgi:hypothetical protein
MKNKNVCSGCPYNTITLSANLFFCKNSLAFALTLISTLEFCFSRNSWRSMAANTSDLAVEMAGDQFFNVCLQNYFYKQCCSVANSGCLYRIPDPNFSIQSKRSRTRIPDSGIKKTPNPGSGSATLSKSNSIL